MTSAAHTAEIARRTALHEETIRTDRWAHFDSRELNEIGIGLCELRGAPSPMIKEIAAEFRRREHAAS